MIPQAQSIAAKQIQASIRIVFQSILQQAQKYPYVHPLVDTTDTVDVVDTTVHNKNEMIKLLLRQFRDIWKRKLIDKGYDIDVVDEWFMFLNDFDRTISNDIENENEDNIDIDGLLTTGRQREGRHEGTTNDISIGTFQPINQQGNTLGGATSSATLLNHSSLSQNQESESTNDVRSYTTAWGKLRHLNRRQDLLSDKDNDRMTTTIPNSSTSASETVTTSMNMIEQLDTYGYRNETYWIKDRYPSIQKYANEQIDMRLYYATSRSSMNAKIAPNDGDESSLQRLLLVDRKRKSVNRKKLVWDTSSQKYLSKEPPKKRRKKFNEHGEHFDSAQQQERQCRTITLPDIPRRPYQETDVCGTLNWKQNMDRIYSDHQLDDVYIHQSSQNPSPELEMQNQSTSLLIGSICDTGQFHFFLQSSYAAQQSGAGDRAVNLRLQHRKAIRTRLGTHVPIRISDDIHGRANSGNNNSRPWSKILRTLSHSQSGALETNNTIPPSTTEDTINVSVPIVETAEQEPLFPGGNTVIKVEQKPQYWFDFDIGYCVLEYVIDGTRKVHAFSNIELSLSDD